MMRASFIEAVSRQTYWIGVAVLTLVLIGLSIWGDMYDMGTTDDGSGPVIENPDPLSRVMHTPVGVVVVLLVLQFVVANMLFWAGAWAWYMLRKRSTDAE